MVIVAFLTLKMVVIMVFWYCMYITHVKLALPLHPELMFNENFMATHMALFMKYKLYQVRFICLSSQGKTHTSSHSSLETFLDFQSITILSFVALDIEQKMCNNSIG